MERIVLLLFLIFCSCPFVFGNTSATPATKPVATTTTAPTSVPVQMATPTDCIRSFPIGYEKLFYLTLAGASQLNYQIKEMQTKGGFIVFTDNNNKMFLASVIYVSSAKSMLKLAPCDNTYNFTISTPTNLFKYIEANQLKTF